MTAQEICSRECSTISIVQITKKKIVDFKEEFSIKKILTWTVPCFIGFGSWFHQPGFLAGTKFFRILFNFHWFSCLTLEKKVSLLKHRCQETFADQKYDGFQDGLFFFWKKRNSCCFDQCCGSDFWLHCSLSVARSQKTISRRYERQAKSSDFELGASVFRERAIAGLGFHMIIHIWIMLIIDSCARASLAYFKHNLTFTLILYVLYYCTPSVFCIIANCQSQWLIQQVTKSILKITFL